MKVIITGSAGFIGFHLAKVLLKKKYDVYGIDNFNNYYSTSLKRERISFLKKYNNFYFKLLDLNKYQRTFILFKKIKPDIIYHLAAQPGVMFSFKNQNLYKTNNINVTKNLIKISKKIHIKKFYFTSSSSVYGKQKKYPIKENFKLEPLNFYGITKQKCEVLLQKAFKNEDIDLKIFRPFTVYGPYPRPDMLLATYLKKSTNNQTFNVFNNGNYIRDFTYVEDVAKILLYFLKVKKQKNNVFNVCASKPYKLLKILRIIDKYNKKKIHIDFKPYRTGEMVKTFGYNKRIQNILKNYKFTSIEQGIKKTVSWYKNYKNKENLFFNK